MNYPNSKCKIQQRQILKLLRINISQYQINKPKVKLDIFSLKIK